MMDLSILVFFQRWLITNKSEQSYTQIATVEENKFHTRPSKENAGH
ncbi:MAG: hypothetical protein ACQETH_10185 [Candidatus Rifleibacteriota bacterium]